MIAYGEVFHRVNPASLYSDLDILNLNLYRMASRSQWVRRLRYLKLGSASDYTTSSFSETYGIEHSVAFAEVENGGRKTWALVV